MADLPTDQDLTSIEVSVEDYTFEDLLLQTEEMATSLKVGESSKSPKAGVKPPRPTHPLSKPATVSPRGRGRGQAGHHRREGRWSRGGKGKQQDPGQVSMLERFFEAGAPPQAVGLDAPVVSETPTSQELEEITAVSEALSDTVATLSDQLDLALGRIRSLEESNAALQSALTRLSKDMSTIKAYAGGRTLTSLPATKKIMPEEKKQSLTTSNTPKGNIVIAPKPYGVAKGDGDKTKTSAWGQEQDIE